VRPAAVRSLVALARKGALAKAPLEREAENLQWIQDEERGKFFTHRGAQYHALRRVLEKARELDEEITYALGLHDAEQDERRKG